MNRIEIFALVHATVAALKHAGQLTAHDHNNTANNEIEFYIEKFGIEEKLSTFLVEHLNQCVFYDDESCGVEAVTEILSTKATMFDVLEKIHGTREALQIAKTHGINVRRGVRLLTLN
jgi:hypothetical protein